VIAAGLGTSEAYYHHFMVRALDPATGHLLWQDNLPEIDTQALAVAATSTRAVAAGYRGEGGTWLVRCYNASTGAILWTDAYSLGTGENSAKAVTIIGNKAIVAGDCNDGQGHIKWVVRAYNLNTGALFWSDVYDMGDGGNAVHGIASLTRRAVKSKVTQYVVVAGKAWDQASKSDRWLVRAYNARTGAFLWQDRLDPVFGGSSDAKAIVAGSGGVYVVGACAWFFGPAEWVVRAYALSNGGLRWEDRYFAANNTMATHAAIYGNKLFVAGYSVSLTNELAQTVWVRSYKTADGGFRWDDSINITGDSFHMVGGIAATSDRVFLGGAFINTPGAFFDQLDWFLYDYNHDGLPWWNKTYDGLSSADWMYGLAASNGRVFAAGANVDQSTVWHWAVRAFDAYH
jgi:hypothetical protein